MQQGSTHPLSMIHTVRSVSVSLQSITLARTNYGWGNIGHHEHVPQRTPRENLPISMETEKDIPEQ